MKKLPLPLVNDLSIINNFRNNNRVAIATRNLILAEYIMIQSQYDDYHVNSGNPWTCIANKFSSNLSEKLMDYYDSPVEDLSYIADIRANGSADICPMCGSSKTATIDHFLPRTDYPDWAVYSKNLVPACDCNSKRGANVKGNSVLQRVLHPYYDDCLNSRLITAEFGGDFNDPDIYIISIFSSSVALQTIQFHIDTVVKKSTCKSWMKAKWASMRRNPSCIISSIPKRSIITKSKLENYLEETLEDRDQEHGTPNNWYSMFIYGIYQSEDAKNWLLNQHNGIITGSIDPFQ